MLRAARLRTARLRAARLRVARLRAPRPRAARLLKPCPPAIAGARARNRSLKLIRIIGTRFSPRKRNNKFGRAFSAASSADPEHHTDNLLQDDHLGRTLAGRDRGRF